jgi:hypothetical protein
LNCLLSFWGCLRVGHKISAKTFNVNVHFWFTFGL